MLDSSMDPNRWGQQPRNRSNCSYIGQNLKIKCNKFKTVERFATDLKHRIDKNYTILNRHFRRRFSKF